MIKHPGSRSDMFFWLMLAQARSSSVGIRCDDGLELKSSLMQRRRKARRYIYHVPTASIFISGLFLFMATVLAKRTFALFP